jgi:hypothetical protein
MGFNDDCFTSREIQKFEVATFTQSLTVRHYDENGSYTTSVESMYSVSVPGQFRLVDLQIQLDAEELERWFWVMDASDLQSLANADRNQRVTMMNAVPINVQPGKAVALSPQTRWTRFRNGLLIVPFQSDNVRLAGWTDYLPAVFQVWYHLIGV